MEPFRSGTPPEIEIPGDLPLPLPIAAATFPEPGPDPDAVPLPVPAVAAASRIVPGVLGPLPEPASPAGCDAGAPRSDDRASAVPDDGSTTTGPRPGAAGMGPTTKLPANCASGIRTAGSAGTFTALTTTTDFIALDWVEVRKVMSDGSAWTLATGGAGVSAGIKIFLGLLTRIGMGTVALATGMPSMTGSGGKGRFGNTGSGGRGASTGTAGAGRLTILSRRMGNFKFAGDGRSGRRMVCTRFTASGNRETISCGPA